jgi:hypothetical protein
MCKSKYMQMCKLVRDSQLFKLIQSLFNFVQVISLGDSKNIHQVSGTG